MGGIESDERPLLFRQPGLLRPLQDAHDLAVCHLLQEPRLVERLYEPEGQHCREEVAELAPDDGVVVLDARLVELACRLVVPHHYLDFPAVLVCLVDGFRRKVKVALQHGRAE